jgi:tripartite-type tricarboxylate transporter receptor subunit TctC
VVNTPDVTKQLMSQSVQIVGMNPARFATHLRAEIRKWAGIARQANMQDIQAN